jgi:hypothetical protein
MPEQQTSLGFDLPHNPAPSVVPELRDEIAQAWGLPLGERVEVTFCNGQLDAITGVLELAAAPDFPWDPHQPLALRIAGYGFSSRDIAGWTRV